MPNKAFKRTCEDARRLTLVLCVREASSSAVSSYKEESQRAAAKAIAKGHGDSENLRKLLVWTTGDAPWAAANTIADFPASMLKKHRTELMELGQHE